MAFMEGAAVLDAGPLDRSRLSSESLRPPIPFHVEPTATGLAFPAEAEFKALPVVGSEGGP